MYKHQKNRKLIKLKKSNFNPSDNAQKTHSAY